MIPGAKPHRTAALLLVVSALVSAQQQQQAPAPCLMNPPARRAFTRLRLLDVVRDQTETRADYLIRQCGVQVAFTPDLEADLKEAGASARLIETVKAVAPKSALRSGRLRAIKTNPKDGLVYVYVPPGAFRMGCASEADFPCGPDEGPAHDVRILRSFWMGKTEVTTKAFRAFTEATSRTMPPPAVFFERSLNLDWQQNDLPVSMVTWGEAVAYCAWAGGMRLPTEAEWEYAARAGSNTARPRPLDSIAWYADNSGDNRLDAEQIMSTDSASYRRQLAENGDRPHAVALKSPNAFGLYDMLGNVWEWTADWYFEQYKSDQLELDPKGPSSGTLRVLRGASWFNRPTALRPSLRRKAQPGIRDFGVGFRCVSDRIPQ